MFQTYGCASAIASSSALTEMVKGKTVDDVLKVTNQNIADFLGGLPREKMHCSVTGREALEAAIYNYRGQPLPEEKADILCHCFEVTRTKIREVALEDRLTTVEEITDFTKAGGGCGACIPDIQKILDEIYSTKTPVVELAKPKKLTILQRIALIQDVIEKVNQEWVVKTGDAWDAMDKSGKDFAAAKGISFITLSDAENARWATAVRPILDDYVAKMQPRGLPGAEALAFCKEMLAKQK